MLMPVIHTDRKENVQEFMYITFEIYDTILKNTTYTVIKSDVFFNQFEQCITSENCVELFTESAHYDSINVKSCFSIRVRYTNLDQLERLHFRWSCGA